jgi:hypothetical protein
MMHVLHVRMHDELTCNILVNMSQQISWFQLKIKCLYLYHVLCLDLDLNYICIVVRFDMYVLWSYQI